MKSARLTLLVIFVFSTTLYTFGQTVRVAVIGDFGAATMGVPHINNEAAVADLVKSWDTPSEPLDAIITVGDNNYPTGASADIEANIGQFYGEYIKGHSSFLGGDNRFFPSIGNHDYGQHNCNLPGNPYPFTNYFELPGNELYYDFVLGDAHFFVVDSDCHQTDGTSAWSTQAEWLETQMTNSTHKWKIVYFHHAPYSSTPAGNTGYLQWDFKAWGATAIICGHYHLYERLQVDGLTYFVNGIGGNSLHEFTNTLPYSQVRFNEKHGAMLITFDGNEANFKAVDIDHKIFDDYTIVNTFEPTPSTGDCSSIPNHTKLGEFEGHGYFISNNNAPGWDNANDEAISAGANLVSIESQAEKDFLDTQISGNSGEQVIYTGLFRNNSNNLEWTSGESFNLNNYSENPWEGVTSIEKYGTLRKWNPNAQVFWDMESGHAYRKYILEKTCVVDCSNQGGDSDGDGVCDNEDCSPNDPSLPATVGSSCNDNNASTINDVIQTDGCTCQGILEPNPTNDCTDIPNYTKLGELNGKGYFLSNFNASGWEDAQMQSILLLGTLVTLKTQTEKDFIDQFITGLEDHVMYIGLKRNDVGILEWSDGSFLDISNFDDSPWEGGVNPSSDKFGTLRKWNPTNPVLWGMEGGNANRKFILEKTCTLDCTNQGGDTDNDGVCDSQDCAPSNPNFPVSYGTPCNDGDPNTTNDIIMEDGCNCMGTPILGVTPCDEITINPTNGKITIENITVPIAIIKIYNSDWEKVFECNNTCTSTVSQDGLLNGIYHIELQFFDNNWNSICTRATTVNIISSPTGQLQNVVVDNNFNSQKSINSLTTYPNPTQDYLMLDFGKSSKQVKNILIYDSTGKLIQQFNYKSETQNSVRLDTEKLIEGVYLINVELEGEPSVSKRFIIKR